MSIAKKKSVDNGPLAPLPGQRELRFEDEPAATAAQPAATAEGAGAGPKLKGRIDPKELRIDWDEEGIADAEEKGPEARFGGPPKDNFVMAHPTWSLGCALLDCRDSGGRDALYVLSKEVARRVIAAGELVKRATTYLLIDRDGQRYFWAVMMGDARKPRGEPSEYVTSAELAIMKARRAWTKITWPDVGRAWKTRESRRIADAEPEWPADPEAMFLDTIGDRYIDDPESDTILRFLGEK